MKILVLVKEVFDTESKITLESPEKIGEKGIKYIINPYDEFALEEGIRIKEKTGAEVVVLSVGPESSQATLKNALAMGADRATLINAPGNDAQAVSQLLAQHIQNVEKDYDLIVAGWVAIDTNNGQVPGRLSQLLNIPLANVVTKLNLLDNSALCEREGDNGQEVVEVKLPAMIAVQKGINEPRYPTMKNIMAAKKKKIEIIPGDIKTQGKIQYQLPQRDKVGKIYQDMDAKSAVSTLLAQLIEDGKAIK